LKALEHRAQSAELAEQQGDSRSQAIAHENLALSHLILGHLSEALKAEAEGRKIARRIADTERLLSLDLVRVEILIQKELFRESAAILEMPGAHQGFFQCFRMAALLAFIRSPCEGKRIRRASPPLLQEGITRGGKTRQSS